MNQHALTEATEWFARLRAPTSLPAEREDFARWLAISPDHIRAYLSVVRAWGDMALTGHAAPIADVAAGTRLPPESQDNAVDSDAPEKLSRRDYRAQVARIVAGAAVIFGSQALFEWWLVNPAMTLNRQRPIDLLETSSGVDILSDHLTRIEHGVYT